MERKSRVLTAVSLAEARQQLLPLIRTTKRGARYVITQHGRPEAVVLGADEYFAAAVPPRSIGAVVLAASGGRKRSPVAPAAVAGLCRRLLQVGLAPVVVVTDAGNKKLQAALTELEVAVTFTGSDNTGFSSSLKRGVRFAAPWCGALLVLFASMPEVSEATLRQLLAAWRQDQRGIIVPEYDGRRGHPLLFAAAYAKELLTLDPRWGLLPFMRKQRAAIRTVAVRDPNVLRRR